MGVLPAASVALKDLLGPCLDCRLGVEVDVLISPDDGHIHLNPTH